MFSSSPGLGILRHRRISFSWASTTGPVTHPAILGTVWVCRVADIYYINDVIMIWLRLVSHGFPTGICHRISMIDTVSHKYFFLLNNLRSSFFKSSTRILLMLVFVAHVETGPTNTKHNKKHLNFKCVIIKKIKTKLSLIQIVLVFPLLWEKKLIVLNSYIYHTFYESPCSIIAFNVKFESLKIYSRTKVNCFNKKFLFMKSYNSCFRYFNILLRVMLLADAIEF